MDGLIFPANGASLQVPSKAEEQRQLSAFSERLGIDVVRSGRWEQDTGKALQQARGCLSRQAAPHAFNLLVEAVQLQEMGHELIGTLKGKSGFDKNWVWPPLSAAMMQLAQVTMLQPSSA